MTAVYGVVDRDTLVEALEAYREYLRGGNMRTGPGTTLHDAELGRVAEILAVLGRFRDFGSLQVTGYIRS